MADTKHVTVQYYAILREQRGTDRESVETAAATPEELYASLKQTHGFSLDTGRLRVIVNEEFVDWHRPLEPNDTVVFVPPVAGG